MSDAVRTRFAPSPSGNLHLGHAYSAISAYNFAKEHDGEFILRIEDIDQTRCDQTYIDDIYEDLEWLGLKWIKPVRIQSEHYDIYQKHIDTLSQKGLLYPCKCTRKEIRDEILRSGYAPHEPEAHIYPGICRDDKTINYETDDCALRLNLEAAFQCINHRKLFWEEGYDKRIQAEPQALGDVVLARKDIPTTYHLSVVIDDALQGITHIIRGKDLFSSTHIHRLLQELFGFKTPIYHHHDLLCDDDGNRLAKRDKSKTIKSLRDEKYKPEDIYDMIGLKLLD